MSICFLIIFKVFHTRKYFWNDPNVIKCNHHCNFQKCQAFETSAGINLESDDESVEMVCCRDMNYVDPWPEEKHTDVTHEWSQCLISHIGGWVLCSFCKLLATSEGYVTSKFLNAYDFCINFFYTYLSQSQIILSFKKSCDWLSCDWLRCVHFHAISWLWWYYASLLHYHLNCLE